MSRLYIVTLLNLYAEYIMQKARLHEAQASSSILMKIKIARRNNLRYTDDTTFMAGSEEELKSFLMKVKEKN